MPSCERRKTPLIEHKTPDHQDANVNRLLPWYWVPVILWVGFLFLMSTGAYSDRNTSSIIGHILRFFAPAISETQIDAADTILRKLAHVTEYFIFGMLLFRAFRFGSLEPRMWQWAFSSLMVLVICAVMDEVHQSFVPERTASAADVVIDTTGGILALCISVLRFHRHRKRKWAP